LGRELHGKEERASHDDVMGHDFHDNMSLVSKLSFVQIFFGISAAKQFTYHIFLFWINFWCIYARQQYIESPLFWTINYILVHSVTYPRHVIPPTITGYSGFGSTGPGLTIDDKQLMVSASRPSVYRHHHTWSSIIEHTKQKRKTNQQ